jgi:hypothetical protein
MILRPGAWLGIDVGSSEKKVLAFCLVTADAHGAVRVTFERGGASSWPANKAGTFLDMTSPRWLAQAAESGVRRILESSLVVSTWLAPARDRTSVAGAAIDAPCGFASAGHTVRETELHAATSFATCDAQRFQTDLERFAQASNHTPLRQRFFWKLVGFAAYRSLMASLERGVHDCPLAAVTAFCSAGLDLAAPDGTLPAPLPGSVPLREAFPSDTYARANGTRGVLRADARALLRALVLAPWDFAGTSTGRTSSKPTPHMQARLLAHRHDLAEQLAHDTAPLLAMRKIPKDPSWADLWDAFACAFATVCEAHGAAVALGGDRARLAVEGTIVAPVSQPAT